MKYSDFHYDADIRKKEVKKVDRSLLVVPGRPVEYIIIGYRLKGMDNLI